MKLFHFFLFFAACLLLAGTPVQAQEDGEPESIAVEDNENQSREFSVEAGALRETVVGRSVSFDIGASSLPEEEIVEVLWNFGDGIQTTGESVTHTYRRPGTYTVALRITTENQTLEDTTEVRVFERLVVLLADDTAPTDELELQKQQAQDENTLLLILKARSGGTETLIEEELTRMLLAAQEDIRRAHIVATWASGGLGANVLSRFGQQVRQTDDLSLASLEVSNKGIVLLSDTSFGLLSPTAQSTYDQLEPSFVVLARPESLSLITSAENTEEALAAITNAPLDYRLLGEFSSRAVSDLGVTNFMSFGINLLINQGVPINNIVLILMIPVIASILSFARQVIGIKSFGIVTPAMTTLSFLVLGLKGGLIVFVVVLLSGSLTRFLLRKLHLLYLPRMALVLTVTSLAILLLFGFTSRTNVGAPLSLSIFPILILNILAEEFIAVQFSRGPKTAFRITAWTLLLSVLCYFIVSWQPLRTLLLSYPELILLAIPLNIALGRFTGLRVVEYFRFRELLRYVPK